MQRRGSSVPLIGTGVRMSGTHRPWTNFPASKAFGQAFESLEPEREAARHGLMSRPSKTSSRTRRAAQTPEPPEPMDGSDRWAWAFLRRNLTYQDDFRRWRRSGDPNLAARWGLRAALDPSAPAPPGPLFVRGRAIDGDSAAGPSPSTVP